MDFARAAGGCVRALRGIVAGSSIVIVPRALGATHAAPQLVPGPGFVTSTPTPFPQGAAGMPGADAKVIGAWDIVPYQTFTSTLNIGVIAFHMNGVDRVE